MWTDFNFMGSFHFWLIHTRYNKSRLLTSKAGCRCVVCKNGFLSVCDFQSHDFNDFHVIFGHMIIIAHL